MPEVDAWICIEVEREVTVDIDVDDVVGDISCSDCGTELSWSDDGAASIEVEPCQSCKLRSYERGLEDGRKEQQLNLKILEVTNAS